MRSRLSPTRWVLIALMAAFSLAGAYLSFRSDRPYYGLLLLLFPPMMILDAWGDVNRDRRGAWFWVVAALLTVAAVIL